jgi:sulfate adenylyltransferase subunit 1 (EFTu-like GTPase family)
VRSISRFWSTGLPLSASRASPFDVAYRAFTTDRRKFIVADTPGHEQYTRNMATGASTAELAVILVDAAKGCSRRRGGTATSCR